MKQDTYYTIVHPINWVFMDSSLKILPLILKVVVEVVHYPLRDGRRLKEAHYVEDNVKLLPQLLK